jgi:hypothetical protein
MRFNEKSDVQKHFSNKHRPKFLHEAKGEDHLPRSLIEITPWGERAVADPIARWMETLVHSS